MALIEQVLKYSPNGVPDRLFLKCILTGNYTAGGDPLNLNPTAFQDPNGIGILGYPDTVPQIDPAVFSQVFTGAYALYQAQVVQGATLGTYKLQIQSGGVELAAGAYPAGLLNQYVIIEVVWN